VSKHLILDPGSTTNWRLPAETDLDGLRAEIKDAMRTEAVYEVAVEMGNDPRQRGILVLNGRTLTHAGVIELPDHQG
jgi:hypothetical protein